MKYGIQYLHFRPPYPSVIMTMMTTVPPTRKKRILSAAQWDGTPLRSVKRAKGAMVLGLDSDSDSAWVTELEKIRIRAWTQHRALHVRHAHAYTQERLVVVPMNT
jgi:hypothetical protein